MPSQTTKWQQREKEKIDNMNNSALFEYLIELTEESGDGEMQAGIQNACRIAWTASYAKVIFMNRCYHSGFFD